MANKLSEIDKVAMTVVKLATHAQEYVNGLISTARNALNLAKLLHKEYNNKGVESAFSNDGVFSKMVYRNPPSNLAERRKRRQTLIGTNHHNVEKIHPQSEKSKK